MGRIGADRDSRWLKMTALYWQSMSTQWNVSSTLYENQSNFLNTICNITMFSSAPSPR
jgi:hypothetical protein